MSGEFSGEQPPFKVLHEARQGADEPDRATAVVTSRQRLPNRRACESFEFRHAGPATLLGAALDALAGAP